MGIIPNAPWDWKTFWESFALMPYGALIVPLAKEKAGGYALDLAQKFDL
jgi:hypothetical protein